MKKRNKKRGTILISIFCVILIAVLIGLIITGKVVGWGPFSFLRLRSFSVSEQPFKYEHSTLFCQNGDKQIFGTLYMPEDEKETRGILILCHGFNVTSDRNAYLAKSFASSGIAVYAFDFCGGSVSSKSDGKMTEMSILTEKSDLNCVIDMVKSWDWVDKKNIILLGESQGGCVAALTAAERNDISDLVLFYPALVIPSNTTKEYESIEDIPENPIALGQKLGRIYMSDIWGMDAYKEAAKYMGPVLIVHGTDDNLVPVDGSEKMNEMYADSELYLLQGAGHGFVEDQVREAVTQAYEFLIEHQK